MKYIIVLVVLMLLLFPIRGKRYEAKGRELKKSLLTKIIIAVVIVMLFSILGFALKLSSKIFLLIAVIFAGGFLYWKFFIGGPPNNTPSKS